MIVCTDSDDSGRLLKRLRKNKDMFCKTKMNVTSCEKMSPIQTVLKSEGCDCGEQASVVITARKCIKSTTRDWPGHI